jgi:hypothetical protein
MINSANRFITRSLILTATVAFAYFWTISLTLPFYTLTLIGFLIILYSIIHLISKRKKGFIYLNKTLFDVFFLSLITFLLVFSTGALNSPVFFLIYFLLFGVALLLEPVTAIYLAVIISFFLFFTQKKDMLSELLQLSSLFLIAPLATIFGKQYIKLLQSESKIKILETEGKILEGEIKRQETEVKSWTYQVLSKKLVDIQDGLKSVLKDPQTPDLEKEKIKKIFGDAYALFVSGKEMEKKIEE